MLGEAAVGSKHGYRHASYKRNKGTFSSWATNNEETTTTTTTTTTTVYFNEVVFSQCTGVNLAYGLLTTFSSTLTCPKHLPYKVPSLSYLLSTLLSISSWVYLSLHYHLSAVSQFSLTNTIHLSSQHDQTTSACFITSLQQCYQLPACSSHTHYFYFHLKLTPVIHLNILISLLCIFLISSTFVGHVSLPYNIAGLMYVV